MKGDALTMDILLVLAFVVIFGLFLVLYFGQNAENLGALATIHCTLIPQLCEKAAEEDTLAYESAKSLFCGIGAVGAGKVPVECEEGAKIAAQDVCKDVVCCDVPTADGYMPTWMKNEQACLKTSFPNTNVKAEVIDDSRCVEKGGSKLASEVCRQAAKEAGGSAGEAGINPNFECDTVLTEQEPVLIVEGGGRTSQEICESVCGAKQECKAELNPVLNPFESIGIMEKDRVMQCSCDIKKDVGENAISTSTQVEGLSLSSISRLCRDIYDKEKERTTDTYSLSSCKIIESKKLPEVKAAEVKGVLQACACRFNSGEKILQYKVYGNSQEQAWKRCSKDFDLLKNVHGQDVSFLIERDNFIETCRETLGDFVMEQPEGYEFYSATLSAYRCGVSKETVTSCKITNFALPQKISTEEDWIIFYGDPKYLVYWQSFPIEQDTWSFKPDTLTYVVIGVLATLPWGKAAWGVTKGLVRQGAAKATDFVKQKVLGKTVTKEITQEELDRLAGSGLISKASLPTLTKKAATESVSKRFIEAFKQRYANFPAIRRAAIRAGYADAAAWAAAYFESKNNNFIPVPNSVVLDIPYKPKLAHDLPEEMMGMPVLVDWDPGALSAERIANLHFASPCRINELDVEKKRVVCDEYAFNEVTGGAACTKGISLEGKHFWRNLPLIGIFTGDQRLPMCKLEGYLGIDDPAFNSMDIARRTNTETLLTSIRGKYPESTLKVEEMEVEIDEKKLEEEGLLEVKGTKWVPLVLQKEDPLEYSGMRVKFIANGRELVFADMDDDGFFESYGLGQCRTESVVVTLPRVDEANLPKEKGEFNYCVDTRGRTKERLAEIASPVLTVGGIVLTFVPGAQGLGIPLIITRGALFAGSALGGYSLYQEYKHYWPGSGG